MDVTYEALYALYGECFPCYPLSREWFFSLLALEQGEIFTRWEGGALAGAAVLHGDSLPLLCVGKSFRGRGLGSQLLAQAEERAKSQGHSQVVLGQGPHYLFQGVPEENPGAVEFFQKRGYQAAWSSVNMRLDLAGMSRARWTSPRCRRASLSGCWKQARSLLCWRRWRTLSPPGWSSTRGAPPPFWWRRSRGSWWALRWCPQRAAAF